MIGRSENGLTKYLPASKTFNACTEVAKSLERDGVAREAGSQCAVDAQASYTTRRVYEITLQIYLQGTQVHRQKSSLHYIG
jgi:hypothetical protein